MSPSKLLKQPERLEKFAAALAHAADVTIKAFARSESKAVQDFQAGLGQVRDRRREVEEVLSRGIKLTNKRFRP